MTFKVPFLPFTLSLTQKVTYCLFSKLLNHFSRTELSGFGVISVTAVTVTYYDVLHSLEEETLLDIFLVHIVFVLGLCSDLHTFTDGWDHHPLRSEGNMTPQQLSQLGLLQNSTDEVENVEVHTATLFQAVYP